MAARMPHLPYDSFPPLADYDRAEHLVESSREVCEGPILSAVCNDMMTDLRPILTT